MNPPEQEPPAMYFVAVIAIAVAVCVLLFAVAVFRNTDVQNTPECVSDRSAVVCEVSR